MLAVKQNIIKHFLLLFSRDRILTSQYGNRHNCVNCKDCSPIGRMSLLVNLKDSRNIQMAIIKIKDLGAPGSALFSDSESYLNELTEDELDVSGGVQATSISVTVTVSYSYSWTWSKSWTY